MRIEQRGIALPVDLSHHNRSNLLPNLRVAPSHTKPQSKWAGESRSRSKADDKSFFQTAYRLDQTHHNQMTRLWVLRIGYIL